MLRVERKDKMESSAVRVEQGTVRETYSISAWRKAMIKYSFEFVVNGDCCSAWFNPQNGETYSDCPGRQRGALFEFAAELEQIIRQPKPHLDSLTVRKFLCEHLRAMIDVETELRDSSASECRREFLNLEPGDLKKLSPEEQRLLKQIEEAEMGNGSRGQRPA
jgi:hypothetical protein